MNDYDVSIITPAPQIVTIQEPSGLSVVLVESRGVKGDTGPVGPQGAAGMAGIPEILDGGNF